jgi:hypothetical protein
LEETVPLLLQVTVAMVYNHLLHKLHYIMLVVVLVVQTMDFQVNLAQVASAAGATADQEQVLLEETQPSMAVVVPVVMTVQQMEVMAIKV